MINSVTLLQRELLVGARQRATWILRLAMAAGSALIGAILYWWMQEMNMQATIAPGRMLFEFVTWMGFCATTLFGVFFAADAVSAERREGTLGLLFLTRLRVHDVVFGKLAATLVRSAYALLAALPVIALPMLMGGVAFKTYAFVALVLANTLFLSTATGLAVSAFNQQPVRAVMGTLLLLLILILLPVVIDSWIAYWQGKTFVAQVSIFSPGHAHSLAAHNNGRGLWPALALQHALGWGLLGLAALGTRRLTEKSCQPSKRPWIRWLMGREESRAQRIIRDRRPVQWLTMRRGRGPTIVGLSCLILMGGYCGWEAGRGGLNDWFMISQALAMVGMLFYLILLVWIASEAARRTGDARREGAIELILATPLTVREVVAGFWRGMVRMFVVAVLAVFLFRLVGGLVQLSWYYDMWIVQSAQSGFPGREMLFQQALGLGFSLLNTLLLPAALAWTGLWLGLRMEKPAAAAAVTFVGVAVVPAVAGLIIQIVGAMLTGMGGLRWTWLSTLFQGVFGIALYAGIIVWARVRLLRHFREAANGTYRRPRVRNAERFAPQPPPLPA